MSSGVSLWCVTPKAVHAHRGVRIWSVGLRARPTRRCPGAADSGKAPAPDSVPRPPAPGGGVAGRLADSRGVRILADDFTVR